MKKNSDFSGLLLNVLIATAVMVFIVFGLNKIGLYDLPAFLKKIVSSETTGETERNNEEKIYGSANFDKESENRVEKNEISYENAKTLLENVTANRAFSRKISVTIYSGDDSITKRVNEERKDDVYSAEILSSDGTVLKQYIETGEKITAKEYLKNGKVTEFEYPKGAFTVSELCGVILTPECFLEGEYVLSEGDFSLVEGDFGVELEITFVNSFDGYDLKEIYRVNPDYGIVTRAESYEGETLVYLMQTDFLK